MVFVIILEPSGDLVERRQRVRQGIDAHVVALEGSDEGLTEAVAFGARDRGEAGHEVELGREDAGLAGGGRHAELLRISRGALAADQD